MLWLYWIPTWLLGIVIVGGFTLLSCVGMIACRPLVRRLRHPGNDVVSYFISITSVVYALILGLLAVATWDSLNSVDKLAMNEALQVDKLYWDLSGYSEPTQRALKPMLVQYLHEVIEKEWPEQQRGIAIHDEGTVRRIVQHWAQVQPVTEGEKAIHGEAMRQLNELLSLRRARKQASSIALPASLWIVVVLGGILNIGLTYLIVADTTLTNLLLTGAAAAMIGLMIFMIVAVDHPLWGGVSVSSHAYSDVLNSLTSNDTGSSNATRPISLREMLGSKPVERK